jgi:hypothetical protein
MCRKGKVSLQTVIPTFTNGVMSLQVVCKYVLLRRAAKNRKRERARSKSETMVAVS